MKRENLKIGIVLFAALVCLFIVFSRERWTQVVKDDRVTFLIERALYEKEGYPNFYIHVKAVNLTANTIGIDFRDPWLAVYPNQWGPSDLDHRTNIDEETMMPKKLDDARRRDILQAYQSNALRMVPPRETLDYYINFNGSRLDPDIRKQSQKFLLLSIKGQMFFSDGTQVWDEQADHELALREPVRWKKIPKDAFVITR